MRRGHRWLAGLVMAAALGAAFYCMAASKVRGDVLNSYPFVTLDGYDWLLEGNAVAAMLAGNRHIDLPILRNPVYVLCIAADAALGGGGRLLLAIHAAAFAIEILLLLGICELLGTDPRLELAMPALLGLSALGSFRFAIFPDDVAIVFLLGSVVGLLRWRQGGRRGWLFAAGCAAVCGALTQEYATLPLVAAALLHGWRAWRRRTRPPLDLFAVCAASGVAYLALSRLWSAAVPHRAARDVWIPFLHTTIRPALVLKFDALLWLHVFWPLAALLGAAAALAPRGTALQREAGAWLATTIAAFVVLILAYRWPDARYTYALIPLVLLLCCAAWTRDALPPRGAPAWPGPAALRWLASPVLAAAVWSAQGVGLIPPLARFRVEGVQPLHRVDAARVPGWPTLGEVGGFAPLDRFAIRARCGSATAFCPASVAPPFENDYDRVVLCEYRALKLQGVVGTCGNFAPGPLVTFVRRRAPPGVPTCIADATHLCLQSGRFRVAVTWRVGRRSGPGMAMPMTGDSGGFWFFDPASLELAVKVTDGRPVNGHFWVFYAALSDVAYSITVTDTATAKVKTYTHPAGTLASVADAGAF
jgi:hypothetical protein